MKNKHPEKSAEVAVEAGGSQPGGYVFGSVSGSLFPNKTSSGSASLSSLFTSTATADTQLYVPAPKPVPKAEVAVEVSTPVKVLDNQREKKTPINSAAEQQVVDRERSLQNADEGERVPKKTPKKRKAAELGEGDEEVKKTKKPRKRTKVEFAEERLKMKRTVFVGNLPLSCTKKTLKVLFKDKGTIESTRFRSLVREDPGMSRKLATIQRQAHTKKTSINAYVVFSTEEEAQRALERNGTEVEKGVFIRVDKVSQNSDHDHNKSIFVGNLPFDISELPLRRHFEECGTVQNVRLVRDKDSGMGKGFGYILFESADAVQLALKLCGSKLEGRSVRVKRSVTKDKVIKMAAKKGPKGKPDKSLEKSPGKGEKETEPGREKRPKKKKDKEGFKGKPGQEGSKGKAGQEGFKKKPGQEGFKGKPGQEGFKNKQGQDGFKGKPGQGGFKGKPGQEGFKGKPVQGGFKGKPGQSPRNKFTGKSPGKSPGKTPHASSTSFKGEMADPTKKANKKGLKKKNKPRKRDQAVHI